MSFVGTGTGGWRYHLDHSLGGDYLVIHVNKAHETKRALPLDQAIRPCESWQLKGTPKGYMNTTDHIKAMDIMRWSCISVM